jgi:hypothetical protein
MAVMPLLAVLFFIKAEGQASSQSDIAVQPTAKVSRLLPDSDSDDVDLAARPETPPISSQAYGRLDVKFLSIPPDKLDLFRDLLDRPSGCTDLTDVLKQSDGKVVASTSTGLRTGGDGAMLEIADSRLTLLPKVVAPNQFYVEGRITRATFSGTFNCFLRPGSYQLLVLWDQPPHAGIKDSYNAVVARLPEIHWDNQPQLVGTPAPRPGHGPIPPDPPAPISPKKTDKVLYTNHGDNTEGFDVKFYHPNFTPHNHVLIGNDPGHHSRDDDSGWLALPVSVESDFRIDYDVYSDARDGSGWLILFDDSSKKGLCLSSSPRGSSANSINIFAMENLTDRDSVFDQNVKLATASTTNFPDQTWTHVTITKAGNMLTENVGGQIISTELPVDSLPKKIHVGLGYYATKNLGGDGEMSFANILVVETKPH